MSVQGAAGRWPWIVLVGVLVVVAVALAWADSTVFRPLFPQPFTPQRRLIVRPIGPPFERREPFFAAGLGPVGGLYSFWWFLSAGAGQILVALAVLVAVPRRARQAAQRVRPAALSLVLAASVASALLGVAVTVLLRASVVLLSVVPLVWALLAVGAVFGVAVLALAVGRLLVPRLGPAPPLVAALAALLALLDVGLVPAVGWVLAALVAVAGLGLAVLTRMGSPSGWNLDELKW